MKEVGRKDRREEGMKEEGRKGIGKEVGRKEGREEGRKEQSHLRGREHVGLGAVDAYWNLSTGGAQLLEQSAVRPDPQVLLCHLHLWKEQELATPTHTAVPSSTHTLNQHAYWWLYGS